MRLTMVCTYSCSGVHTISTSYRAMYCNAVEYGGIVPCSTAATWELFSLSIDTGIDKRTGRVFFFNDTGMAVGDYYSIRGLLYCGTTTLTAPCSSIKAPKHIEDQSYHCRAVYEALLQLQYCTNKS